MLRVLRGNLADGRRPRPRAADQAQPDAAS
jgi:hypothetical protein